MKIGILTGGGDCAGLNAALRAATQYLWQHGVADIVGFEDGFLGLLERRCRSLDWREVDAIIREGGTILGTCNKANPFNHRGENRVADLVNYYHELQLDGIIAIGGDGTMSICGDMGKEGLNFIGVPKTIDNDLADTEQTFGFDSAVAVVSEAIDRLQTTARSHHRTMIIETMGRYAGWIALYAGVAGGADVVLIPERPFSVAAVAEAVNRRREQRGHAIIVVAEGALVEGGSAIVSENVEDSPDPIRLGGIGRYLQQQLRAQVGCEVRSMSLGHVQRGGSPTAADRILASSYGCKAAQLAVQRRWGRMVALQAGVFTDVAIDNVAHKTRVIPRDHHLIRLAEGCGVCFGDPEAEQ